MRLTRYARLARILTRYHLPSSIVRKRNDTRPSPVPQLGFTRILPSVRSVDLATGEAAETQYQRSDVCAVPAASVVGEAMVAWVLADALLEKFGGDNLAEIRERVE